MWWERSFSVFQTNLQEIDAGMDVDAALDFIEAYGSDTWLLNVGGIVSFYPTDLACQTRNPFLDQRPSGDLVGDAVAAARQRGIKVIARLDMSKVATPIAQAHPEWLFVSPSGEPQVYNSLYSTCPSGGYYQQCTLEILDEIIDRYSVDGFFFNWFNFNERDYSRVYQGVCHCESCLRGYAAHGGGSTLPSGPESDGYWDWLRFAGETTAALTRRIAAHITARRPDVGLLLRKGASIAYSEASNAFGTDMWHHETAEAVSAHVSAFPSVPIMVNSVAFVDMPYRMAAEQPERFAHYLVQTIARGGNPSTYIMGAPGRVPYANVGAGREVTQFHRTHAALYSDLRPAATTAVVRPHRFGMRPPSYRTALEEFRGVYAALQQTHHPFDVLPAEGLADMGRDGLLRRYSLIIVPDLGPVGSATARALDEFVEQGGNLLTTGSSAVTEGGEIELASSPALARIGTPHGGEDLWSTYVTLDEQPHIDEMRYAPSLVPVFGSSARFELKPAATSRGFVLPQAPFGPPEKCYGHTGSDDPAVVTIAYGAGTSSLVPWTVGRTWREFGTTEVRQHLLRVVAPLATASVTATLPEQVEMIVGRDQAGLVIHLINMTGARHRSFGPHVSVDGGQLRLGAPNGAVRAEALVADQELQVRQDGHDIVVDLPRLELFEVVRVYTAA